MTIASVIIPAYNAEKSIESCQNALHNQTGLKEQPEITVVHDGSTENTSLIVKKYEDVVLNQQKMPGWVRREMQEFKQPEDVFYCLPTVIVFLHQIGSLR